MLYQLSYVRITTLIAEFLRANGGLSVSDAHSRRTLQSMCYPTYVGDERLTPYATIGNRTQAAPFPRSILPLKYGTQRLILHDVWQYLFCH